MDFEQKKRPQQNENMYHIENLKNAREFSKNLLQEMGELIRSIVLFGSNTHNTANKNSDIDIMIVLDNISVFVTPELREAYRIITEKISSEITNKLHVMTVNLSDLWDMARKGDPLLINILRYGTPLFDRDLVEPMQYLLEIGKIKPTRETIYNYMSRSNTLYNETKNHLIDATLDLYYSSVDMIHATLMIKKIMPPSPKEMPKIFKETFKDDKKMLKHSQTFEELIKIAKDIEHRKIGEIVGGEYEKLKKKTEKMIFELEEYNKDKLKTIDDFEL